MDRTNAERQARFRARRDAELAALRKGKASSQALAKARAEIKRLRQRVGDLEAALAAEPKAKPAKAAHARAKAKREGW